MFQNKDNNIITLLEILKIKINYKNLNNIKNEPKEKVLLDKLAIIATILQTNLETILDVFKIKHVNDKLIIGYILLPLDSLVEKHKSIVRYIEKHSGLFQNPHISTLSVTELFSRNKTLKENEKFKKEKTQKIGSIIGAKIYVDNVIGSIKNKELKSILAKDWRNINVLCSVFELKINVPFHSLNTLQVKNIKKKVNI